MTSVPPPRAAFAYALRLGCISFGGPAGQIAILHREVVDERAWLSDAEFTQALQLGMLLPGPEALQLVIYLGRRWHGTPGALVAGLLFLLPAALLLTLLSFVYVRYGPLRPVAAAIMGLQCVVVALLVQAVQRLGRRTLAGVGDRMIAFGAFLAVAVLHASLPAMIAAGALAGFLRRDGAVADNPPDVAGVRPAWRPVARVLALGVACWLVPLVLLALFPAGPRALPVYLYFTRVALGGFGGAYAVLTWVNQELVAAQGWLQPGDLLAGLALAETTPGPLLIVLQFYGFASGWHAPGAAGPAVSALACGALASIATFLPSFVLVLALAPLVEWLQAQRRLAALLSGVSATVVGVIASFALTVMLAVLWPRGLARWPDPSALVLSLAAGLALARHRVPLPWVLACGALAGVGLSLAA